MASKSVSALDRVQCDSFDVLAEYITSWKIRVITDTYHGGIFGFCIHNTPFKFLFATRKSWVFSIVIFYRVSRHTYSRLFQSARNYYYV